MLAVLGTKPVAIDQVTVGIEMAKERVGQGHLPDIGFDLFPIPDDFRPLDLDLLARGRLIDNPHRIEFAAPRRIDALAVGARMNRDGIARLGQIRRALNRAQRRHRRSGIGINTRRCHMNLHRMGTGQQHRRQPNHE